MPNACVLLAPGFEEIEAITVIDVLRRAGVETMVVSLANGKIVGAHDITVQTDLPIERAMKMRWDMVVLPGGMPGAATLRDDPRSQSLIAAQHERRGGLAAICAAPIALARAGILAGAKATSYPSFAGELGDCDYVDLPVAQHEHITTSRGPATAMRFALHLVERLCGPKVATEQAKALLAEYP
jgi:4-methyl-5(b-hydroxyethyl)-thiazole monophosphate biosynthesis